MNPVFIIYDQLGLSEVKNRFNQTRVFEDYDQAKTYAQKKFMHNKYDIISVSPEPNMMLEKGKK